MSFFTLLKQVFVTEKIFRWIFFAGVPAVVFYLASVLWLLEVGFDLKEILTDPAQHLGHSSFLGFVSNIGIWLWVSSTAICFFAATTGNLVTKDRRRELLILAGLLSLILAVDDFFLLHDRYLRQSICFLFYAVVAGALLIRHYKVIFETEGFAFLLAGSLLALSIVTDLAQNHLPFDYSNVQAFEDGFKFVGAATWLYFSYRVASFRPGSSGAGN